MTEEKSLSQKLLEGLGNLIPDDQKEQVRKEAEKVAKESMEGLDQFKLDVEKMVREAKKGADEALKHLEETFVEFQSNVEQLNEKRRMQADDIYNKLGVVTEKLRQQNFSVNVKSDLSDRTQQVMASVQKCGDKLTEETVSQARGLLESYQEVCDKANQDLKDAVKELTESITNYDQKQIKNK